MIPQHHADKSLKKEHTPLVTLIFRIWRPSVEVQRGSTIASKTREKGVFKLGNVHRYMVKLKVTKLIAVRVVIELLIRISLICTFPVTSGQFHLF